jgi:hypothetical protein
VVGSGGNTVTPVNSPMAIPTLDWRGMMFLVLLVAVLGAGAARRRRWV